jgi:S-disulfanyl-L-cysteine oxidoreductase SoxD
VPPRHIFRIFGIGVILPIVGFSQTATTRQKTVWDGVFNQAEADRGATAYQSYCSGCHGESLQAFGGVLIGEKFNNHWREDNLHHFFQLMSVTMPPGGRARPSEAEYVDILAYLLKMNEFPAGSDELVPATFENILIVGKDGPKPVPDFSLVMVVGCLSKDAANRWMLTHASEPVRTRNPRKSTEAELAAAKERAGGEHTFHFLDTYEFPDEFKSGRWMEAKGFLIRSSGNDRINLSWLQGLRETCDVRP